MKSNKTVMTITGIRPDFIRMSEVFKKLDKNFNHILVHTGQHYDALLSGVFFDELNIREPDYNLNIGSKGNEHFHQQADLSVKIIELVRSKDINPDIILFLGDSNSVLASVPLKKEGYKIGHIEAGMRSGDRRMLEEINRIVCDHCSDLLFVYHQDYKQNCTKENIPKEDVYVVGNTIVESCKLMRGKLLKKKRGNQILLDIHRPENFKDSRRLYEIMRYATTCRKEFYVPIRFLRFKRTFDYIGKFDLDFNGLEITNLMSHRRYLEEVYHSLFLISDSGTAQEEPALFDTPVIVPRDFTERPQSMENNCSYMLDVNNNVSWRKSFVWLDRILRHDIDMDTKWLGDGTTSNKIVSILQDKL